MMKTLFILLLNLISACSYGVVQRHDVDSKNYQLIESPPYLVDMPHEGHGVLIGKKWILTVAHTIFYDYVGKEIVVGTKKYKIESVHLHPGYEKASERLFDGDAGPLITFLRQRSDIALVKLTAPVDNVNPIKLYRQSGEIGKQITVFGRGATGDGLTGEIASTKSLRQLNYFRNVITGAQEKWLSYTFDPPTSALPLEGIHASGDSGGASVVSIDHQPYLVGLSSWQMWQGDLSAFKGGLYGAEAYQVRVSSYLTWILAHINSQ